ncbi:MAG: PAS domain-containing protein [Clostridia bacterium]|nr:PAS domain-containing protein [Clostridia bacterium]
MRSQSIASRFLVWFAVLFVLIAVQGGGLQWTINKHQNLFKETLTRKECYVGLKDALYQHNLWLRSFEENEGVSDASPLAGTEGLGCAFSGWLSSTDPMEGDLIAEIKTTHSEFHESAELAESYFESGNRVQGMAVVNGEMKRLSNILGEKMYSYGKAVDQEISLLKDKIEQFKRIQSTFLYLLTFTLIMAAGMIYVNLKNCIINPLSEISESLKRVNVGDFSLSVAAPCKNDEIKSLSKSFNEILKPLEKERVLRDSLKIMAGGYNLDSILNRLLDLFIARGDAAAAAVYLPEEKSGDLKLIAVRPSPDYWAEDVIKMDGSCIGPTSVSCGNVFLSRGEEGWNGVFSEEADCKFAAGFPITYQESLLGYIFLGSNARVTGYQVDFYTDIASQLGVTLKNIKHFNATQAIAKKLEKNNRILDSQKRYMEAVLRSSVEGIYSVDKDCRVRTWSNGAEHITGYKAEDIIGGRCGDFLTHSDTEGNILCDTEQCIFAVLNLGGDDYEAREMLVKTRKGFRIPCMVSAAPIKDEFGQTIGTVGVFRDISKEKENIRKIKQASEAKSEFLSIMSHELRTPLNSILGFSELLGEGVAGELNEKQKRYVNNILYSGGHLLSLINDILDISKIEAGKMEWETSSFDLVQTAGNSMVMLTERAERSGINLELDIQEEEIIVKMDERKIKQILYNLLSNAVKFTPEGGRAGLRVKNKGEKLYLEVWDEGVGIPREKMDMLFEPFVQLDGSLRRKHEGTGLGLHLVKRMVELGGGSIRPESTLGEGSRFIVEFPNEVFDGA